MDKRRRILFILLWVGVAVLCVGLGFLYNYSCWSSSWVNGML